MKAGSASSAQCINTVAGRTVLREEFFAGVNVIGGSLLCDRSRDCLRSNGAAGKAAQKGDRNLFMEIHRVFILEEDIGNS